jgi:hypothetical protein
VHGQLRGEPLSVAIATECGHCHQPLHIEVDSDLSYRVVEQGAAPLVYAPFMDEKKKAAEPSIIEFF